MYALTLNGIEHWIDDKPLFKAISLTLAAGECCHLKGPNGVGKSTLLHMMLNLLPHHAGHIHWEVGAHQHAKAHHAMAYMGHQLGMSTRLTVNENLKLWKAWYQCSENTWHESQQHTMDFKLTAHQAHETGSLSAGQQQRLAWVRLLMQQKPIWLLDESLTHMDQSSIERAAQLINQHTQQGGAVIYTSHQDVASLLCNHRDITMEQHHD
jgi:heme exporter protein A